MTFSLMTLSLSVLSVIMLTIVMLTGFAEGRDCLNVILSVINLNVVMLSVVVPISYVFFTTNCDLKCVNGTVLIIEGTTEKVSQFVMPIKLVFSKNFYFNVQKFIFEHCEKLIQ
jgi:hypothetical protein